MSEPVPRLRAGLVQPDGRSCGAASLVLARMLLDPAYAALAADRFGAETLALHRRISGPITAVGRAQLPWPRVIGTPPWAVAHQLSATGGPGADPTPYGWRVVRHHPADVPALLAAGLATGRPVALYVGDRWLPRHVVLAVDRAGGSTGCYDPGRGRGRIITVPDEAFSSARLPFGRWVLPWFVVAPALSPARRTPA